MAREFTGNPSRLLVGDVPSVEITGTALTVHAWIRPDTFPANQSWVGKWASGQQQYLLFTDSSSRILFAIGDGAGSDLATGASTLARGQWRAVGGVKNGTGGGAISVYLDGVSDGTNTSNRTMVDVTASLMIGANNFGDWCDGWAAEVAIWDLALTAPEMATLATGVPAFTVQPGNLRGYWPLCGVGDPEPDMKTGADADVQGTTPRQPHPWDNSSYCGPAPIVRPPRAAGMRRTSW